MSNKDKYAGLNQLGGTSSVPSSPEKSVLESVENPHKDVLYNIRFICPEFTSLCPVTGQPDFAHIVIDFVPREMLVESKSLKLYMSSYRNHAAFHEECTIDIAKKIIKSIKPVWLRIGGYWYPRGGIPIDIFYQTGDIPSGVWVPVQDVQSYRGRG